MKQKIETKSKVSVTSKIAVGLIVLSFSALAAAFVLNGASVLTVTYVVDVTDLSVGGADPLPDTSCKSEAAGGGICSLREAIKKANTSSNLVSRIEIILPSATMSLSALQSSTELIVASEGDLDITTTKPIYIYGKCSQDSSLSIIDASNLNARIFELGPGTNVNISCVKLVGGSDLAGGAIYDNNGTLNISNGYFQNNSAEHYGGAIYAVKNSIISIDGSAFNNNSAVYDVTHGEGGALCSTEEFLDTRSDTWIDDVVDNTSWVITNSTFNENSAGSYGGALVNSHSARISDSNFTSNSSIYGGAIFSGGSARLTITGSSLSSNTAGQMGGAISFWGDDISITNSNILNNSSCYGSGLEIMGNLELSGSVVEGNDSTNCQSSVSTFGGGISVNGTATIDNSSIVSNISLGHGGGIFLYNDSVLTMTNSNISSNQAEAGGGLYAQNATASLVNCTLDSNNVTGSFSSIDDGGSAVANSINSSSIIKISYSTITNNTGGQGAIGYAEHVNLKGTIMFNNFDQDGNKTNCNYGLISSGYNIDDNDNFSQCFIWNPANPTDVSGIDPLFTTGLLADNGGDTQTMALSANSPAKDAIPVVDCTDFDGNPISTDQRGILRANPRTTGANCDIGAYEFKN